MNNSESTTRYFEVSGKVQNVMFRQTLIRAMIKRGVQGGATNDSKNKNLVKCMIIGGNEKIQEIIDALSSKKPINSWGAKASEVKEVKDKKELQHYQVTTENVDTFEWKSNVDMYI